MCHLSSHETFPTQLIPSLRSKSQKDFVKKHSPIPGITVDTNDLLDVGIVLLVGCGGLIVTSAAALLTTFVSIGFISRALEALAFGFWALWIFACDVANTVVSRQRSAKILAGGVELPPGLVQSASQQLGVSPRYWSQTPGKLIKTAMRLFPSNKLWQ